MLSVLKDTATEERIARRIKHKTNILFSHREGAWEM